MPANHTEVEKRLWEAAVTAQNRRVNPQQEGEPEPIQHNQDQELDPVEEALLESFPASDPPAWIGRVAHPLNDSDFPGGRSFVDFEGAGFRVSRLYLLTEGDVGFVAGESGS